MLPEYTSSFTLISSINMFHMIKMKFSLLEACLPAYSFVDIDIIMPICTAVCDTFHPLSCDVFSSIIHKYNRNTCWLDPFPTKLLLSHFDEKTKSGFWDKKYRTVANLSFIPKIIEKAIATQINTNIVI